MDTFQYITQNGSDFFSTIPNPGTSTGQSGDNFLRVDKIKTVGRELNTSVGLSPMENRWAYFLKVPIR